MDSATARRADTDTEILDTPLPPPKGKRKRAPKAIKPASASSSSAAPESTPEISQAEATWNHHAATSGTRCDLLALRSAVSRVANVCDLKTTMPMLQRIAVRYSAGKLAIEATDLELALTVTVPATSTNALDTTLDARMTRDMLKVFPTGECVLYHATDTKFSLDLGVGDVKARLFTLASRDYPKIERGDTGEWFTIDAKLLRELLDDTADTVCKDSTRFHLGGVLLESVDGETLRAVATDGHRLVRSTRAHLTAFQTRRPDSATVAGVILPAKAVRELRRLLDDGMCEIQMGKRWLHVRQGDWTLAIRPTDAAFPPYQQVIPSAPKALVTVDREALIDACKRAKVMCSDTRGMKFILSWGTHLIVESDHPDAGDLREQIVASFWNKYDGTTVGVNHGYLLTALQALTCDRVQLGISGELDPVLIRDADDAGMHTIDDARYVGVVMPMRI